MNATRVLHVEDDRTQRVLIANYLGTQKEHKYEVTGVESEGDAVDKVRRGGVDLIILDYQLAQGDGLNCLRKVRRFNAMVPVIVVSGIATPAIGAQLLEAGANAYLRKQSLDKRRFSENLENVLAHPRGIRAKVRASSTLQDLAEE